MDAPAFGKILEECGSARVIQVGDAWKFLTYPSRLVYASRSPAYWRGPASSDTFIKLIA